MSKTPPLDEAPAPDKEWPDYTDAWWWWYPYAGWDWSADEQWLDRPTAQSEVTEKNDSDDEEDFIETLPDVIKGWLLRRQTSITWSAA